MTLLLRAGLVLAAALLVSRLAPAPSLRRDLLTLGALATVALPLLALLPALPVALPDAPLLMEPVVALATGGSTLQEPATAAASWSLASLAVPLWAAGVAAFGLRVLVGAVRIARLPHEPVDPAWEAALHTVRPSLPVHGHRSDGPLVAGWLRPRLFLPAGLDWDRPRRVRALRHELAHVRSHDTLRLLLAQVVCAVHWCNPLAWLLARELRVALEQAADQAVLHGGSTPADYAADLVDLGRRLPLTAGLGARPLERRVRALLAAPTTPLPRPVAALLATGLVVAAALLAGTHSAPGVAAGTDVQAIAEAEVRELVARWNPQAAAIVVVDARSGEVVARATHGEIGTWSPGSVAKPFVAVAALQRGVTVDADHVAHLLEVSDNAGFVALAEQVGTGPVAAALKAHGLGATAAHSPTDLALGQFPVTTTELAKAYANLADHPHGETVIDWLTEVVHGDEGTGRKAAVLGTTVAGKTGTSRLGHDDSVLASFVGLVPAEDPRWAIAVQVAGPQPTGWGGQVAAPGFARVATQLPR